MPAACQCDNGHEFTTRVTADDPETNVITLEDEVCPECGANFEIHGLFDDGSEDD